jgi:quercetin dioxygenase-like cupin family protein
MSSKSKYVKNLSEIPAYRVTKPEGHNRSIALLVDKPGDGAQNVSMGLCIIDPKSKIAYHTHENEADAIYIVKGNGIAKFVDFEQKVSAGSVMFCPPKVSHQIINTGNKELWFVFAYSPPGPEQNIKNVGTPRKPLK